jgi:hypothetical protein
MGLVIDRCRDVRERYTSGAIEFYNSRPRHRRRAQVRKRTLFRESDRLREERKSGLFRTGLATAGPETEGPRRKRPVTSR